MLFMLQRHKTLFVLSVVSFMSDIFSITIFGPNLFIINYIALFYAIYFFRDIFNNVQQSGFSFFKYLFAEYFLLIVGALIFGFLFPWDDSFSDRLWNQRIQNRALVALVKSFTDIMVCYYLYFIFMRQVVSISFFLKTLTIVMLADVGIAILDFLYGYPFKTFFTIIELRSQLLLRFTGLSGEPRAFGRCCGLVFLILTCANFNKINFLKYQSLYWAISLFGLLISISVSAIIATSVSLFALLISNWQAKYGFFFLLFAGITIMSLELLRQNELYDFSLGTRINRLEQGNQADQMIDEPAIFTKFEVFDRAALNFFYHNPRHLWFGAGPNLINYPAGDYISRLELSMYEGRIDNPPSTGMLFIVARSGLVGLCLYVLLLIHLYKKARKTSNQFALSFWLVLVTFTNIIVFPFFILLGFLIGILSANQGSSLTSTQEVT